MKAVKKWFRLNVELVSMLWKKIGDKVKLENNKINNQIKQKTINFRPQ